VTSAARKSRHHYIGAPWPRGSGSQKSTKMERTKQSKADVGDDSRRSWVLPLVIKPSGAWGYKFGKMRKALKKGRL